MIGSQTAGADGNVATLPLPGAINMNFTGLGIYYPDRAKPNTGNTHRPIGSSHLRGIREGRYEVLERAVEIIKQGK